LDLRWVTGPKPRNPKETNSVVQLAFLCSQRGADSRRCRRKVGLLHTQRPLTLVTPSRFVTYRRVSTNEQGRSGLGLDAQQRDVELYLATVRDAEVLAEYVEVASGGKGDRDRPELAAALELCRSTRATLLVAKLDRLSRNVAFVANLLEDKRVEFVVAALPRASRFELHLYAALAEQEREFVSQRTKAALAAAKARGVKLGGARNHLPGLNATKRQLALETAKRVASVVLPLRSQGATLREVAQALNGAGVATQRGGNWQATQVARVLTRLEKEEQEKAWSAPNSSLQLTETKHKDLGNTVY